MTISFRDLMYKQLLRNKRLAELEPRVETMYVFHGHEAGDCARKIFLRHKNTPPEGDKRDANALAELQFLFSDGYRHQESIVSLLKQCPNVQVTNEEEGRIVKCGNVFVSGHPDLIVHHSKAGRYVGECKGLNHFFCQKLVDGDIESLKTVYHSAIPQTRIYSAMYDTDGGYIWIKNKNTSKIYEFFVPRNEEAELRILEKFNKVFDAIVNDMAPPCDYLKGDTRCKFCPYPSSCGVNNDST